MHELSVCQSLIAEAQRVAAGEGASTIERIDVTIGPLSGVEAELLSRAFEIARVAAALPDAELAIEVAPVRVECRECGKASDATANRLLCAHCGDWRVKLVSGAEMILKSVELSGFREALVH